MQLNSSALDGVWYYDPVFLFCLIGVTMGQGALGVVVLISLRRWRHQGSGTLNRWSQATWSAFLTAGISFTVLSMLPLPLWLASLIDVLVFALWVTRAAQWAAQE